MAHSPSLAPSLAGILMTGFLGAGATVAVLWSLNAAWWALILGYGFGGAVTLVGSAVLGATLSGAFDGMTGQANTEMPAT